jgi:uncharacterized protein YukE
MTKIVPGQRYADIGEYDKFDDYTQLLDFLKGIGDTYSQVEQRHEAEQVSSLTMIDSLINSAENPNQLQFAEDSLNNLSIGESDNPQINLYKEMIGYKTGEKKQLYDTADKNIATWMSRVSSSDNDLGISFLDSTPGNLIEVWNVHKDMPDKGEGYIQTLIGEFAGLNSLEEQVGHAYGDKNPAHIIKYADAKGNQVSTSVRDVKYNINKYRDRLDALVYGLLEDRIISQEEAMLWSSITGEGKGAAEKAYWDTKQKKFEYFKAGHDRAGKGLSDSIKLLAKSTEDGSFGEAILQSVTSQDGETQNTLTNAGKQSILDLARSPGIVEAYGYRDLSMLSGPEEIAAYIEDDILRERISAMDINALTNYTLMKNVDEKAMFEKGLDAYGYTSYYKYEATDQAKAEERRKFKELANLLKEQEIQKKTDFQMNIQETLPAIGELGIGTPGETEEEAARRLDLETGVTEAEGERYPVSSGETEQEAVDRAAYEAGAVSEGETEEERKDRLTPKYDLIYDIDKRIDMKPLRDPLGTDSPELVKYKTQSDIIDAQRNIDKKEVSKVQEDFNVEIDNPTETVEYANKSSQFVSEGAEMASAGENYDWSNLSDLWDMTPSEAKVAGGALLLSKTPEIIKSTAYTAQHLHSQLRLPKDIINNMLTDTEVDKMAKFMLDADEKLLSRIEDIESKRAKMPSGYKGDASSWDKKIDESIKRVTDKEDIAQNLRKKQLIDHLAKKHPDVNRVHLERAFDMRNKTTWNYFKLKQNVIDKFGKAGRAIFTHKYSPTQLSGKSGGIYMAYNTGFALSNWASNTFTGEDASTSVNRVTGLSTVGLTYKLYNIMSTPSGKAAFKQFLYKSLGKKAATTIGSAFVSGPGAVIVALASTGMLGYDIYNFISNYDEEKGVVSNLKEQGYVAETEVGY